MMLKGLVRSLKGWLGRPLATPETDPQAWFGHLAALPNPDPILRSMGRAEEVYRSIMADAHVIGDVRSIRGNFRGSKYRINAGDPKDRASCAARDLVEQWMADTPPGGVDGNGIRHDWLEVMWQMTSSIFYGYRAHECVVDVVNGQLLPVQVLDRPNRRFRFNAHGEPLLISTGNMLGAPIEWPGQFVISRHMADATNPYGVALMSSCFWPWTFKTGGWRYFVKYCERHGLPWPVGRYPQGTGDKEIEELGVALANMIEAGYIVAPDGTGLELLTPSSSGSNLPQEALIDRANREMSKALTGQAMVSELQGVGARAASETAARRQAAINDSDRDIAVAGMGQLFENITRWNFGPGVAAPWLEFYTDDHAGIDRARTYQIAADMGARPSRAAMLDELGIPAAESDDDALQPRRAGAAPAGGGTAPSGEFSRTVPGYEFARAAGMTDDEAVQLAAEAADRAIEDYMIQPVAELLARYEAEGKSLAEFSAALADIVGVMDNQALQDVTRQVLQYSILKGAATQAD